jgi:hypothetical protein
MHRIYYCFTCNYILPIIIAHNNAKNYSIYIYINMCVCVCHKNDIMLYTLSIIVPSIYRCTQDGDDDGNNVINDNCILYYIISYRINRMRTLMALDVHGTVSRQTITRGERDNACARDWRAREHNPCVWYYNITHRVGIYTDDTALFTRI